MDLNNITNSKYMLFIIIFLVLLIFYCLSIKYLEPMNKINKSILSYLLMNKKMMPDEIIFRNMIDLPGRDPLWLTSSMVAPIGSEKINDEKEKISRMEALNIMYNDGINDNINISHRPIGLFVIP